MLQALRGTIDSQGIRTLRVESGETTCLQTDPKLVEFWVVVDSDFLNEIQMAMIAGDRIRATRLLSDTATSMGSILPS